MLNLVRKTLDKAGVLDYYKNTLMWDSDWDETVTKDSQSDGTATFCAAQGQEGYVGLQPMHICSDGVLSGCSGSDSPADGTPVRACGVGLFQGDSFGGVLSFENATSVAGVPSYTDGRMSGASSLQRHLGDTWWILAGGLGLWLL